MLMSPLRYSGHAQLGPEFGCGLHGVRLGSFLCQCVVTVRRFLANMGTEIVPPIPSRVFELAQEDIAGTSDSAMKL